MTEWIVFYDAENAYTVQADTEEQAATIAREEHGEGWQYIEKHDPAADSDVAVYGAGCT